LEDVWRRKTDEEVAAAARRIDDYTEEGGRVILGELERRQARGVLDVRLAESGSSDSEDAVDPADAVGVIRRAWLGYVSLPVTYWALWMGGGLLIVIARAVVTTRAGAVWALPLELSGVAYYVFTSIAVWRSANRYRGRRIWAQLAQVAVAASAARRIVRLLFDA
jgi:hypothetical protein